MPIFKPGLHREQAGGTCLIVSVWMSVCVFVGVSAPEASNNQWRDMDPCDWLTKFYSCYLATVVIIINGHGLRIGIRRTH